MQAVALHGDACVHNGDRTRKRTTATARTRAADSALMANTNVLHRAGRWFLGCLARTANGRRAGFAPANVRPLARFFYRTRFRLRTAHAGNLKHIWMIKSHTRRDAASNPVLYALDAALGLVKVQTFSKARRATECLNELGISHAAIKHGV